MSLLWHQTPRPPQARPPTWTSKSSLEDSSVSTASDCSSNGIHPATRRARISPRLLSEPRLRGLSVEEWVTKTPRCDHGHPFIAKSDEQAFEFVGTECIVYGVGNSWRKGFYDFLSMVFRRWLAAVCNHGLVSTVTSGDTPNFLFCQNIELHGLPLDVALEKLL